MNTEHDNPPDHVVVRKLDDGHMILLGTSAGPAVNPREDFTYEAPVLIDNVWTDATVVWSD